MEIVYFTLVAGVLYFAANFILNRIETHLGRHLKHRSVIFLLILLGLALPSFALLRGLAGQ